MAFCAGTRALYITRLNGCTRIKPLRSLESSSHRHMLHSWSIHFIRRKTTTQQRQTGQRNGHERSIGLFGGAWKWFSIPVSGGIAFLAVLQLLRTTRRENKQSSRREPETWQLALFRQLPSRMLSRTWGRINSIQLPVWSRRPLLGLYVWMFGCNMSEAQVEDLREYTNLVELFTRQLKRGARDVSREHPLVCPSDGKVLHFGRIKDGQLEQVKGVTYKLQKFLGPNHPVECKNCTSKNSLVKLTSENGNLREDVRIGDEGDKGRELYHVILYLAPGDYHHFHSPADWKVLKRRHFPGELLTVAPWAARKMPGLFALNERAVLSGCWEHGFFSMTAVGAFNVGSINVAIDKDLQTNIKGHYRMGEYRDKEFDDGVVLDKGGRVGGFNLGSSVVLIFEAPKDFQFQVEVGQKVFYGQPLGTVRNVKSAVE